MYMKIIEMPMRIGESGDLCIPASILQEMGLSPNDEVYVAYLTKDGNQNEYQEFLISPQPLDAPDEGQKLMIPSPLLEQANLAPGDDIQIICMDGAIMLCGEPALDRDDLAALLTKLQSATELTTLLPEDTQSAIQYLNQFIQKGASDYESAE